MGRRIFWRWGDKSHKTEASASIDNYCFNHSISLPTKDGRVMPLFDYEKMLHKVLLVPEYLNSNPKCKSDCNEPDIVLYPFKVKHLWMKKATGLGVTEFMLRFMAWLCVYNDDYRNRQIVIVSGPNIELAIKLIKRMKGLFEPKLGVTFDSKETVLELNGCSIEAYPSNHIDAFRSTN